MSRISLQKILQGVGVKYSGAWKLKKHPRLSIGPSLFLEWIQFPKVILSKNVKEANLSLTTPGLNVQIRCSKILSAQVGLSALIGSEKITRIYSVNTNPNPWGQPVYVLKEKTEITTVTGIQFEQNLFYLPEEKTGITFGIGIFERSLNSSFYDSDFGGKIFIGFYF
jgi:hypothetical protein